MAPGIIVLPTQICRQCGAQFVKNRVDKVYCSSACQDPRTHQNLALENRRQEFHGLAILDRFQNKWELIDAFERETGMSFTFKLAHAPRKRQRFHPDEAGPREEQGALWWNAEAPTTDGESDPVEVERLLRAKVPDPGPVTGQTVAEWLDQGGQVRVLPPGRAMAI